MPMRFPYRLGARTLAVATRPVVRLRFGVADLARWGEAQRARLRADAQLFIPSLPNSELPCLAAAHPGRMLWVRQRFPHYWSDLSGGFDALMASMSGKTRSTLRRKERKWAETHGGTIDARCYASPREMEAFLPLASAVSVRTYQHRLLGAGLPTSAAFRARALDLAAQGQAFGFLLFRDAEPVAYLWCPVEEDAAIYAYVGHLDEHGELSPGTVLQLFALRELCARRAARFYDLTPGRGQHKQVFSTGSADCAEVVVLDRSLSNRWLVASQQGFHGSMEQARSWMERAGLAGRLRRLIRGQAA
jgi:CelD/BcsL family acetyltransferase involved in cellulose biosynthesis